MIAIPGMSASYCAANVYMLSIKNRWEALLRCLPSLLHRLDNESDRKMTFWMGVAFTLSKVAAPCDRAAAETDRSGAGADDDVDANSMASSRRAALLRKLGRSPAKLPSLHLAGVEIEAVHHLGRVPGKSDPLPAVAGR